MRGRINDKQLDQKNIVNETICWEITDDFPRLKRSEINSLISKASYSISISSLDDFIMQKSLEEFLKNG